MPRLPQPGADDGTWGDILNQYLLQSHGADGTLKSGVVGTTQLQDGSVTESKLDAATQAKLNQTAPVTSVNTQTGNVLLTKTDIGLGNVDNTSDAAKPISAATQTALNSKVETATSLTGAQSIAGGGNLAASRTFNLVGDSAAPGNNNYYGTDGTGTKGYHLLPASGVQSVVAGTGISVDNTDAANPVIAATSSGVLLIDNGGSVPAGTAVGTVIFEKGPLPSTTTWDFRNLSALPSGWVRRGVASETFAADGMTVTYSSGQGHQFAVSDFSDCNLRAKLVTGPTSGAMIGPIIANSAGTGAMTTWYGNPVGALVAKSTSWSYGSVSDVTAGTPAYPVWLQVRKSGTNWYSSYSSDGVNWSPESPAIAVDAGTIGYISIGSVYNAASIKLEQVVFTTGAGTNTGKAKGWWDGSAIQPLTI